MKSRVLEIVQAALASQYAPRVAPTAEMESDLEIDLSADAICLAEIAMAVEDEWSIEIADRTLEGWRLVSDILATAEAAQGVPA